ncbi:MAG: hypothetical protein WBG92_25785, partial [Thiohalocapsa sp.]
MPASHLQMCNAMLPHKRSTADFARAVLAGLFMLLGGGAMAIDEPAYDVVREGPGFQLRRYQP